MAHQVGALGRFGIDEVDQLVAQTRPVAGDGVARIVAKLRHGQHAPAGRAPQRKQLPVGAGRKAVGMGEDQGRAHRG
jgi:hypothetical protein